MIWILRLVVKYKYNPNEEIGVNRVQTLQKLSSMCITSIINTFERFMIEYEFGSSVPKMHFEYLQRVFSKTIFGELKSKEECSKFNPLEYYKFIFNQFLKEIDLSWCSKWVTAPIIEHLATIGNTITKLCIEECRCSSETILNLVCQIPRVRSLTLRKCNIAQSELENIGKHCKDLQILNVAGCFQVRDIAIEGLCSIDGNSKCRFKNYTLQQLNIQGTSVTAKGIIFALKHFSNMVSITHNCVIDVIHSICENFENGTPPHSEIDHFKKLTTLCGAGFQNEHKLASCSLLCPQITELTLNCINFQAQVDACIGFTALKKVNFSITTYMSIDLSPFFEARGGNLKAFSIKNGRLSAKTLIKFCPQLESLTLCNIEFEPVEEVEINEFRYIFQHLEELCIKKMDYHVDKVALSIHLILSASPNLKDFKLLYEHELTSYFIDSIIAHSFILNVLIIDVSYSCISEHNMAMLISAAPNLKELYCKK